MTEQPKMTPCECSDPGSEHCRCHRNAGHKAARQSTEPMPCIHCLAPAAECRCDGGMEPRQTTADYTPGSHGCHEALHMASFLMQAVDTELCDHPAVKQNPAWEALATRAHDALFDLYQAIGAEHI